jgi:hypothetical protein
MKKLLVLGIIIVALLAGVGTAAAITNGGFESPMNPNSWNVYPDGYSGLGWKVTQGIGPLPGAIGSPNPCPIAVPDNTPTLEIQTENTLNLAPYEGAQYAELDSFANVNISQMVTLNKGKTYHISFAQTCRPQESGADSILGVYLDGVLLSRTTCDNPLSWTTHTIDVTPQVDSTAELMFADEGITTQSYGVLLDGVKVVEENNVPVPEFPTLALPLAMLIGIIGVVYVVKGREK